MINTLVQLIVIMPYNHSYDRQLLIPASLECFPLSQPRQAEGANAPASMLLPAPTHKYTRFSILIQNAWPLFGFLYCSHLCACPISLAVAHLPLTVGLACFSCLLWTPLVRVDPTPGLWPNT